MALPLTEIAVLVLGGESDPRDAIAALDRDIAEEQEFDASRAGYLATRPRATTTERGA
jgi:hypothetical protein